MGEGILAKDSLGTWPCLIIAGVELPHVRWGGDGEQEVAGIGVVPAAGEAGLVEQVANFTEVEEGPENVLLYHSGGASALESEEESVLLDRDHLVAGFSQGVPVYLS